MDTLATERGFRDILGDEAGAIEFLVESARSHFQKYFFQPVILPVVEPTELFARSVGTDTDIVGKEMFYVSDGHGESIEEFRQSCLRPEGTASAVRFYIDRGFFKSNPLQKIYYFGPMFRNERPQKGRYRQFHQIGAEVLGTAEASADAELISMLWSYLGLVVRGDNMGVLTLRLNSLGCANCRPEFKSNLAAFLHEKNEALCEDCRRRTETNPLRVLDCKKEPCQPVIESAPLISSFWCDDCRQHLTEVKDHLTSDVEWKQDDRMVRGLDYYTRTVFEVTMDTDDAGSQNAVAGGGRYDGLVELLGGPPTPALGFAIGLERLALLSAEPEDSRLRICLASTSPATRLTAAELAERLRSEISTAQVWTDIEGRSLKGQLRRAGDLKCNFTIIAGDDEDRRGEVTVKDMAAGKQEAVSKERLIAYLLQRVVKTA